MTGRKFRGGTKESLLQARWYWWVETCLSMLDGDGNLRHLPELGGYFEQDWKKMAILNIIRAEYVTYMEKQIKIKQR